MIRLALPTVTVRFNFGLGGSSGDSVATAPPPMVGEDTLMFPKGTEFATDANKKDDDVGYDVEVRHEVQLAALFLFLFELVSKPAHLRPYLPSVHPVAPG